MANYAQTVNVIGCIKTTKTHADFDSTAMPLVLYRKNFGTIPVSVEQNAAPLDVAAALTTDKRALTIGLVNPQNLAVPVKVRLSGMRLSGKAQAWTISGDDLMAFNQPGEPRKVDIKDAPAADLNNGVTLKPYSITLWKVPVQ
jgi:alpha-N-arabinofuranosidase